MQINYQTPYFASYKKVSEELKALLPSAVRRLEETTEETSIGKRTKLRPRDDMEGAYEMEETTKGGRVLKSTIVLSTNGEIVVRGSISRDAVLLRLGDTSL
jgi:hypothetical protein